MELNPVERLTIHLLLYHPKVKMKDVRISGIPGQLLTAYGPIDIRGASYDSKSSHSLRLWTELHEHFSDHVDVLKVNNGQPTLIIWNGMVYHLDQTRSYKAPERRVHRERRRKIQTIMEGT